ncbi:MAG: acyl carrier protein [Myxococcota bacterium]
MTDDVILEQTRVVIEEIAERELPALNRATDIASLGLDSLQVLELVGTMERQLRVQIHDEQLAGMTTVGDFIRLLIPVVDVPSG